MERDNDNIIAFYASFNDGESKEDLVKSYIWGEGGLKNTLANLNWQRYGDGLEIILFEIYVNPIPYQRKFLREIGSYRSKEKSIGIPIILDEFNFFRYSESEKKRFFTSVILDKLELVRVKVKRNKLNFNISKLIDDVNKQLNN